MKKTYLEYDKSTGCVETIRTYDCKEIPEQNAGFGKAIFEIDDIHFEYKQSLFKKELKIKDGKIEVESHGSV
jgi:hypothetical protein